MSAEPLIVALGARRYKVERPFGTWPKNSGRVTDVALDERGHVFVLLRHDWLVDPADPRVIELSPKGEFIAGWGGEAIADSHLMSFDRSGRLWVVDRDMHEIIAFSPRGVRLMSLGLRGGPLSPFNHPTDIAEAPSGDFFVSDGYAASQVHRFSADGRLLATWGRLGTSPGEIGEPHSLWVLPDGRVALVDRTNDKVQIFSPSGEVLGVVDGFYRPVAIWGDATGHLFVTDQGPSLHLLGTDGTRLGRCRPMLNGAHGIHGAPNGDIFLAEGNPSRITRLVAI